MALQRLNVFDPEHRRTVNGKDVRQFTVYGDPKINQNWHSESTPAIGRVADALVDETGRLQYLILDLQGSYGNRQVIVPVGQTGVDTAHEKIYLLGLTDSQIANLPTYNPSTEAEVLPLTSSQDEVYVREHEVHKPQIHHQPSQQHSQQHLQQQTEVQTGAYPTVAVEDSEPLETSIPVEASPAVGSREVTFVPPQESVGSLRTSNTDRETRPTGRSPYPVPTTQQVPMVTDSTEPHTGDRTTYSTDVTTVQLLEERIVQQSRRRKVGEVIVRKVIETEMVQVPIRREKLIVEEVGTGQQHLISVNGEQISSTEANPVRFANGTTPASTSTTSTSTGNRLHDETAVPSTVSPTVSTTTVAGTFQSVQAASQFLQAIANSSSDCRAVRISLELTDPNLRDTYQTWIERFSAHA